MVVVLALALAACSGDDDDGAVTTSTTADVEVSSTTTTEEPTTSTTLSREDELRQIVVDLLEKRTELLMNPDPARLTEWLSPNCPCWQVEFDLINEFATNG